MSISTYLELQSAVENWLKRADLDSIIPDFIMLGEKRIFREVRARVMETALSSTIASGVIALPADYLELKSAYVDGSPARLLQRTSATSIYEQYPLRSSTSKPHLIAREGSNFIFGPYPDSTYTIKGIYYAQPTSIATSANTLFTNNPDLYLFASLLEAEPYIKNDVRVPLWLAKYEQIKKQINDYEKKEAGSGSGLQVSVA
jgi:hypothetical protein